MSREPDPTSRPLLSEADPGSLPPLTPALAEGEAIALPPTDDTPDETPPEPPTRIPHLGHALLFLGIVGLLLLLAQGLLVALTHPAHLKDIQPKLLILSEAAAYLGTLAVSWFLFPYFWQRPFLQGIQWNFPSAKRNLIRLIPLGFVLSALVQGISTRMPIPKDLPMDQFFQTQSDIWLISIFGTLLAPLFEEILFRGFLLPAFAIAYDWLSLPRTPAAREAWHASNKLSRGSWVFSAVFTSVLFALLHGQQTAFTWPVLLLLFGVSLVLTTIRVRLRSVAASTLVHLSYNALVFLAAFLVTGGFRHLDKLPK